MKLKRICSLLLALMFVFAMTALVACNDNTNPEDCDHFWDVKTGKCLNCNTTCEHDYKDGVCKICSYSCPHSSHDKDTEICATCGLLVGHWYEGALGQEKTCSRCTAKTKYEVDMPNYVKADAPADKQGKVYYLEYTTYQYNNGNRVENSAMTKHCYVYTPWNYDESKQYNVIYFLHGGGGSAEDYFFVENSNAKQILDNMIANEEMEPCLVVTPTYTDQTTCPHAAKAQKGIANAASENVTVAAHTSNANTSFASELRNDLIPAVEAKYSTYAATTGEADLIAAREHRALCGYSAGSMTTISAGLIANPDMFGYYGSFAGSGDYQKVIESVESHNVSINFYYMGVGGADGAMAGLKKYYEDLLNDATTKFTANNMTYVVKIDHAHTTVAILTDFYNCLRWDFFKHPSAAQ